MTFDPDIGRVVDVHLYSQSSPIQLANVRNTYTKDGMFCVLYTTGVVDKYPVTSIFRVREYA